ncbi:MAG: MFS transporter [Chloroflexia bacterium]
MASQSAAKPADARLSSDFWKFWTGQAISALGDSFSSFALPLLIFKLTNSALNLALTTAAYMLPYLLFGLVIGAWVDRLDRKRLMIGVDLGRAALIASIPLLASFNALPLWWIYAVTFLSSTLSIAFDAADFAAIPSLVKQDDLVTANGRITASYSAARVIGPLLAGGLVAFMPIYDLIFVDALSFLASSASLSLIRTSFNASKEKKTTRVREDVVEGLKYVLGHPVLRNISAMMALVNFVGTTVGAQGVLFAQRQLGATDAMVGWLFSAGSAGVIILSLLAGRLRKSFSFSKVALGALMLEGVVTVVLSFTHTYWIGLILWALMSGLGILFNINTGSLRQAIVPNDLLGRVISIAGVLAWSAIPLGAFLGGVLVDATQDIALVYGIIGVLTILIPLAFSFTPLGHAEDYLPKKEEQEPSAPGQEELRAEEAPPEVEGIVIPS